jgi:radical SAM superfamily enzyme YgiQ (UPF0313 family)
MKENISYEDFRHFVQDNHFDVIGFQVFSYDLNSVKKHLSLIRTYSPESITVAGGAHPSGDPRGIMKYLPELDYAFRGEAEVSFPMFLDRLEKRSKDFLDIPGVIFRQNGKIHVNPQMFVEDLDSLPMPAWDLIKPESYPEAPHGAFTKEFPTAPIIITRGCPFSCTFCAGTSITGRRVRKRSINNVIGELKYLRGRGIREFHIEDDNFTGYRKLVTEFCERLLEEDLGMSWSLPAGVRIDSLDREILVMMERAGCYSIALGIEFGTQRVIDLTKKSLKLEMVRDKLRLFKGLGIKTTGFFLFGVPGETLEEMKQTVRFALELPIDRAQFNNFVPLPGSELWTTLMAEDRLKDIDWDKFFVHDVAYSGGNINAKSLKRLQRMAYLRFYLRSKIMWKLLSEIRSFRHLRFLLRRFFDAVR